MRRNARQDAINRLREQQGVRFHDSWETNFDKDFKRVSKAIVAIWVIGSLLSLAVTVAVIWALITLVLHYTA